MPKQVVIVVEPNSVVRAGLKHIIENAGYAATFCVASILSLQELEEYPQDCIVVIRATNRDEAAKSIGEIRLLIKSSRIVLLGGLDNIQAAAQAIQFGASVCLDDDADESILIKAIELAQSGVATMSLFRSKVPYTPQKDAAPAEIPFDIAHSAPAVPAAEPRNGYSQQQPSFSPREAVILQLLQEGAPNKLIARQLSLTESTVKVHLKSILRKIRVNNRTQAAVWAMSQNVIVGTEGAEEVIDADCSVGPQLQVPDDWRTSGTKN